MHGALISTPDKLYRLRLLLLLLHGAKVDGIYVLPGIITIRGGRWLQSPDLLVESSWCCSAAIGQIVRLNQRFEQAREVALPASFWLLLYLQRNTHIHQIFLSPSGAILSPRVFNFYVAAEKPVFAHRQGHISRKHAGKQEDILPSFGLRQALFTYHLFARLSVACTKTSVTAKEKQRGANLHTPTTHIRWMLRITHARVGIANMPKESIQAIHHALNQRERRPSYRGK